MVESVDIWFEKYRPKTLDDIVGQEHITDIAKKIVQRFLENGEEIPPMMLIGENGTGKTSFAHAFFRALNPNYRDYLLEINASLKKGINDVRTDILEFVDSMPAKECPNCAIIDEFDYMTGDAQASMRRVIELAKGTVFIFCANYADKIIEPLQDRCLFADTRFKRIDVPSLTSLAMKIAGKESVPLTKEGAIALAKRCRGSARKMIKALYMIKIRELEGDEIIKFLRAKIGVEEEWIAKLYHNMLSMRFGDRIEIETTVTNLVVNGVAPVEIIRGLLELVKSDRSLLPTDWLTIHEKLADLMFRMAVVESKELEMSAFLASFYKIDKVSV